MRPRWCTALAVLDLFDRVADARVGHVGADFRGGTHRIQRASEVVLARFMRHLQARPQAGHGVVHVGHQGARGAHREVEARLFERAVVRVEIIVEQVDATAKGHRAVDHADLAVQAPPAFGQQQAPALRRIEHAPVHASGLPALLPFDLDVTGAHAIEHHAHRHAARGGVGQGLRDRDHRTCDLEDVGFEHHLGARAGDGVDQRGEEGFAALEQRQLMVGAQRTGVHSPIIGERRHSSASSATSGKWSDMRAQAAPRGTEVDRQRRPRV